MSSVLVVDDEPGVRRLLDIVLRETGASVWAVPDAEHALEMVEQLDPEVILTDVRLPGMNGMELADHVRNDGHHHRAQILIMSAYGRPAAARSEAFIPKPFDLDELVESVRMRIGNN
ncbi:MAG: response regulator [Dehalococcoidia bacterium]|nr:response regulator [Dehalococcoidia bacterium]